MQTDTDIGSPREADIVCAIWRRLRMTTDNGAVLSMYAAQLALLRQRGVPDDCTGTVDQFQGSEKKRIIVSVGRQGDRLGFLADPRRWNVALSRGAELVIIVMHQSIAGMCHADGTYRSRPPSSNAIVWALLTWCYRAGVVVHAQGHKTAESIAAAVDCKIHTANLTPEGVLDAMRPQDVNIWPSDNCDLTALLESPLLEGHEEDVLTASSGSHRAGFHLNADDSVAADGVADTDESHVRSVPCHGMSASKLFASVQITHFQTCRLAANWDPARPRQSKGSTKGTVAPTARPNQSKGKKKGTVDPTARPSQSKGNSKGAYDPIPHTSLPENLTAFAHALCWHLKRYYVRTPLREGDQIFADDGDSSLEDMLQSVIDVPVVVPPLSVRLQDLLDSPAACEDFCHALHGPDEVGRPPLCFWWGDARSGSQPPLDTPPKRMRFDKGAVLTITLPLSLVWPLVRNAVSLPPSETQKTNRPVWCLDVLTHQNQILREQSQTQSDVLKMKVFDTATGIHQPDAVSLPQLFQPLEWALLKWADRQDPLWIHGNHGGRQSIRPIGRSVDGSIRLIDSIDSICEQEVRHRFSVAKKVVPQPRVRYCFQDAARRSLRSIRQRIRLDRKSCRGTTWTARVTKCCEI